MRYVLLLALAVAVPVAHAEPDKVPVLATVENGNLMVWLYCPVAKGISDSGG